MTELKPKKQQSLDRIFYRLDLDMLRLLGIPTTRFELRYKHYAWFRDILAVANEYELPPEILVDEAYYYDRCQMAPYRLTFHLGSHWKNLDDFYDYLGGAHAFAPGKPSVLDLLRGRLYMIRDLRFWAIDKMCRLAEMPMAYLFTPYRRLRREGVFGELSYLVSALNEPDVATLIGFAKLLAEGDVRLRDVQRLLDWRRAHG